MDLWNMEVGYEMGQLDFQAVDYFVIAEIGSGHFGVHFGNILACSLGLRKRRIPGHSSQTEIGEGRSCPVHPIQW
jgi:hypothetical protein